MKHKKVLMYIDVIQVKINELRQIVENDMIEQQQKENKKLQDLKNHNGN